MSRLFYPLLALAAVGIARLALAADYVGAEVCGTCHQGEYQQWKSSGHSMSLARLSALQQRDRVCRSCHTTDPDRNEVELAGVQCESCHGAGALYSQRYVMKDKVLARLLGLEDVKVDACAGCHTGDGPSVQSFSYDEKLKLVRHKEPAKKAE